MLILHLWIPSLIKGFLMQQLTWQSSNSSLYKVLHFVLPQLKIKQIIQIGPAVPEVERDIFLQKFYLQ